MSDIGSSNNSLKNYLVNVINDYDNPPEIVGLIGDTSGSYSVPHYTYDGGSTDVDY